MNVRRKNVQKRIERRKELGRVFRLHGGFKRKQVFE